MRSCGTITYTTSRRTSYVKSQALVNVRVRASTADGLINEPDQAQGFVQDVQERHCGHDPAETDDRHTWDFGRETPDQTAPCLPISSRTRGRSSRWEKASHLDHLPITLLHFAREQGAACLCGVRE